MTVGRDPDEILKLLVTAHLSGMSPIEAAGQDLTYENLLAVLGAAVAYVGNMVQVIAVVWKVSPVRAWEIILEAERKDVIDGGSGWQRGWQQANDPRAS